MASTEEIRDVVEVVFGGNILKYYDYEAVCGIMAVALGEGRDWGYYRLAADIIIDVLRERNAIGDMEG